MTALESRVRALGALWRLRVLEDTERHTVRSTRALRTAARELDDAVGALIEERVAKYLTKGIR